MKMQLEHGALQISAEVFTAISGHAATNCFGVKGMAARSVSDGIVHLLKKESLARGVKITENDDESINVELHIIVKTGVNLTAVCRSIMTEVRYVVESYTGVSVKNVDVYVDSVMPE